jgi:hypothetical protein
MQAILLVAVCFCGDVTNSQLQHFRSAGHRSKIQQELSYTPTSMKRIVKGTQLVDQIKARECENVRRAVCSRTPVQKGCSACTTILDPDYAQSRREVTELTQHFLVTARERGQQLSLHPCC